jgi:glycosyltransferase involved in cell wall biosynthesis
LFFESKLKNFDFMKILYINEWLSGSWQVQKIHADEFLLALKKEPHLKIFTFPDIENLDKTATTIGEIETLFSMSKRLVNRILQWFPKALEDEIRYRRTVLKIRKLVSEVQPDIILARHNAGLLSVFSRIIKFQIPFVFEVNALISHDFKIAGVHDFETARLEIELFHRADAIFSVTQATSDEIIEKGVNSSKVFTVPNGVDPDKFSPRKKSKRLLEKYELFEKVVVGYVGGFVKDEPEGRDVLGLLSAFKILLTNVKVPIKLLMIGRMDEEYLAEVLRDYGLSDSVVFTSHIKHSEVPTYMNLIDIAVAPYYKASLGYRSPIKLFEYMAMAKPTIIPDVGQASEILINKENAVLVKPESPVHMAEALLLLTQNLAMREEIGKNSRKLVIENYTWKHNANRIVQVCNRVVENQLT